MTAERVAIKTRAGETAPPRPLFVLITVSLGALLAPLNSTMIAVALPVIRKDFVISHEAAGWLVSSYLIAMAVTQPIGGRLGDRLGRARVFRAGLLAFLVFSLAAAVAPEFKLLLVFRTLQAISGAALIPNAMGMLRESVAPLELGRISGWNSAIIGATAAVGPLIGGGVLAIADWRWLFVANVPVIVLALLLALRLQPGARSVQHGRTLDWPGAVLFAAVLVVATLFLNGIGSGGFAALVWSAPLAVIIAIFAWRQARGPAPTAEWRLLREHSFAGASVHILLMNLGMYTCLLATPFFLTEILHRSSTVSGLLLGAMAGMQALVAPVAGRAADSVGRRTPAIASSFIALAAAIALAAGVSRDVSMLYLGIVLAVLGLGTGIGFVSTTVAAIEAVPRSQAGSASGTQSMMRYFGSVIGVGLLSGLLTKGDAGPPGIGVFRLLFLVVAAMLALSLIAATFIRPYPREVAAEVETGA